MVRVENYKIKSALKYRGLFFSGHGVITTLHGLAVSVNRKSIIKFLDRDLKIISTFSVVSLANNDHLKTVQ